jgi:hypothetical protein
LGNLKAKSGGTSGPGNINANRLPKELDDGQNEKLDENGKPYQDPVSLKGYKYNK